MTECFAYIRVSTTQQGDGVSLSEQRDAISSYAQRNELQVVRWFEEKKTAAKKGRPKFNRMLKLLQKREAEALIVHKIDRSARNLKDWARLGDLMDAGIDVHFAHEGFDLSSRGGRLSADIQAVVAADYIRNLREETKKGFYGRLKQGLYPLPAPIGYTDEGGGNPKEIDPVQGPLVRKAFELYVTGEYSFEELQEKMHALGLRNRNGGRVSLNGYSTMLNNPFYYGLIRIKKTDETFEGIHEPLISKQLYDRVQRVLEGKGPDKQNRHRHLFRGLFRCQECGYAMIAEKQKGYVYYRCHTSDCPTKCVREERIDDQIRDALKPLVFSDAERQAFQSEIKKLREEWSARRAEQQEAVQLQLDKVEARLDRLTDAFLDELIEKEDYERRKRSLLNERKELETSKRQLHRSGSQVARRIERFLERAGTAYPSYKSARAEEKRDLVKSVTSNRRVVGRKPIVELKTPFDVVAERPSITNGDPCRDRPRTWGGLVSALGNLLTRESLD